MKAHYSEERRRAIGNLNRGKTLLPSTIELLKKAVLNRNKPIYPAEAL